MRPQWCPAQKSSGTDRTDHTASEVGARTFSLHLLGLRVCRLHHLHEFFCVMNVFRRRSDWEEPRGHWFYWEVSDRPIRMHLPVLFRLDVLTSVQEFFRDTYWDHQSEQPEELMMLFSPLLISASRLQIIHHRNVFFS